MLLREIFMHSPIGVIDPAVQDELRSALLELIDRHVLQQRDRIIVQGAPQLGIQLAKERCRFVVPAPPQILSQLAQTLMSRSDELAKPAGFADNWRQLRPGGHKHSDMILAESARFYCLEDQNALEQATVDQGHTEEGMIGVFACLGEVLESRMGACVIHYN